MLAMGLQAGQGMAQGVGDAAYLASWLERPSLQFEQQSIGTEPLRRFYQSESYAPVWVDDKGLSKRGEQALARFTGAAGHGLNPERYRAALIQDVSTWQPSDAAGLEQKRLSLELLVSDGVMRYAADMRGGSVAHQWDTGAAAPAEADRVALLQGASAAADTGAYLDALAPALPEYAALKGALQRYRTIAAQGGWPQWTPGGKIAPDSADARLGTLRQILVAQGDLAAGNYPATYDAATIDGVKRFQERHNIDADGVVGAGTQAALGVSAGERVRQIAMTMERMRWMPATIGTRYVLVNIPAYRLTAVSGNRQLAMDVIVGKSDTQTPMFSKEITDVILNPSWGVPQKIAVKEMLPKIRKDPAYLARAGYTVTDGSGSVIDASAVDWESVGRSNFAYSIRQNPGAGNALGKVKFAIPDSDDIYLHDTSQHRLFSRAERSLSHGCVRLSDPKALTEFVLNDEGWSEGKIATAYDSAAPRTVRIAPLPVHLVYWTSWVDEQGRAHFSRDIYGKDKPLLAAMLEPQPQPAAQPLRLAMN
ncbi:MAG: L,D-transpeptidase family protein [Alphaproteobacteria bacterium]